MSGKEVYIANDPHEKKLQRALLQYNRPENAPLVREALRRCGREDLIGYGRGCLVPPDEKTVNRQRGKKKAGSVRADNRKAHEKQRSGGKNRYSKRTVRGKTGSSREMTSAKVSIGQKEKKIRKN